MIFIPCKIYFQIENFISADQEKSEHVKIVFESFSNIQIYSWGQQSVFFLFYFFGKIMFCLAMVPGVMFVCLENVFRRTLCTGTLLS